MSVNLSVQSMEDAANIASDFIFSIDNLPGEIQHIMGEIAYKDQRCQMIQQELSRDSTKYIRSQLRIAATVPPPPSPPPTATGKAQIPMKMEAAQTELEDLTNAKILLAQRAMDLLALTRARLGADLARVGILQKDESVADLISISAGPSTSASAWDTPTRNHTAEPARAHTPVASASTGSSTKRRKTASSVKQSSPAVQASGHASSARSRLSRQAQPLPVEEDPDAEGEDEEDDEAKIYCTCRQISFGDMIGCDNGDNCPYQWFHLECVDVNVKEPLPGVWFCQDCRGKMAATTSRKRSRK